AIVGGTAGWHCWAQVGALLGGTGGWHCWAPIIRALIISSLMIGADPSSDNCWALMISALMIGAQQCHPQVPPTCAQQCAH
ncbi:unnamed protein product, partial [Staurois parvus]